MIWRMLRDSDSSKLDEAMLSVWRQALVERGQEVTLGKEAYPVRRTAKKGLAQVDFEFAGLSYRGIEQNPKTKSRWAEMARKGSRVMQFLTAGRYICVVAEGKITHYKK
jgi:hypothetical protein